MALTVIEVQNAKKKQKAYKLFDEDGLYLLVQPNGAKYWRFKYRFNGKEKLLSLGTFPETTMQIARQRRNEARTRVQAGQDPSTLRKAEKSLVKANTKNTFEEVALEWYENQKGKWAVNTQKSVLNSMKANVFPTIGTKPVASLTKNDVLDILRTIEAGGAIHTARRVRQRMSDVFRYAIGIDKAQHNPARDIDLTVLKKPERVEHHAAISKDELPEFLKKIKAYDGDATTRLALTLLLLTFVRTVELRQARWAEFDLKQALWTIPAERMKMRKAHVVPLSAQALTALEELQQHTGDGEYLFPSKQSRKNPCMSENAMIYAIYRMGYHSRMTGHGARSLASTVLNELGFRSDLIEKQLAHEPANQVRAAYNRAEYIEERKAMIQRWGDYLDACLNTDNVLQFSTKAKPKK